MATDPSALINFLATQVGPGIANGFQQGQNNALAQQGAHQALQINAAKMLAARQEAAQQQQYQDDVSQWVQGGSDPAALSGLIAKYPKQWEGLKAAADAKDKAATQADLRDYSSIWSALDNKNPQAALGVLQARREAEARAGIDTREIDSVINSINSGDQDGINAAKGFALAQIRAHVSPDKWIEKFGDDEKVKGQIVGRAIGHYGSDGTFNIDYRDPEPGQLREVKITNPDGSETTQFVRVGGDVSSGTPSGASASAALNNPGAIRFDPKNQWQGQVGQKNGFVQFDTAANGQAAHRKLIGNQIRSGYDTPLSWAQHYAPASDGNDPQAYAQTVANGLGIGINDKIPLSAVPKMAAISARVEGMGTPAAGGAQPIPGAVASFMTKPADEAGAPGDTSKTGDSYLATLSPTLAAQVKALSEGRLQIPTGAALRSPKIQQLWAAAAQYDPDLDQANAKTRYATRKEFTSGKAAANITSFNTVLHHIDTLQHAANDLDNGSFVPLNAVGNAASTMFGGASVKKFNAAKQAVVDELERAFRGSSGSLAGIKGWEDTLSSSSSPQQIQGVISQMANLLAGRIEALGEQYTAGMGKSTDGINLLDSKARATLTKLADGYNDRAVNNSQTPAGAKQIGTYHGKPVFLLPDGKRVVQQ